MYIYYWGIEASGASLNENLYLPRKNKGIKTKFKQDKTKFSFKDASDASMPQMPQLL